MNQVSSSYHGMSIPSEFVVLLHRFSTAHFCDCGFACGETECDTIIW